MTRKKKHRKTHMSEKLLCMALSLSMVTGSRAPAAFAADTEAKVENASSVELTCETEALHLMEGRSVDAKLCLTQEDDLIEQKIFPEDVVLGGAFGDMYVTDVRNDNRTILLDLAGIPDFTDASVGETVQGTMEFPGFLFGGDDSVTAGVDVIRAEGEEEEVKPAFRPFFEAMRGNGDYVEMNIVLMPILGEFTEAFGPEDISFAWGMKNADLELFKETEGGCRQIIISVPKEDMKQDESGYSCFGSILLSGGSMYDPDGEPYEGRVYSVRDYSVASVGRDMTENDVNTIKGIVGGYGNTTFGTISGIVSGGASALSAGYQILGVCGVFPTESSRHAEIMAKLQEIQNSLNDVNKKCDYMSSVLDAHTEMFREMGITINEQYLGGFDAAFNSMVESMDSFEHVCSEDAAVREEIEEVIERVAEKYRLPQKTPGREIDEDLIVPDPEYYEYDYVAEADGYAEEAMAFDELIATGGLFDETGPEDAIPDAISVDDDIEKPDEAKADHPEAGEEETETETEAAEGLPEDETTAPETQAAEDETGAVQEQAAVDETTAQETPASEDETTALETQAAEDETGAVQEQAAVDETTALETKAAEDETTAPETQAAEEKQSETAAETQPAETKTTEEAGGDEIETEISSETEAVSESESESESETELPEFQAMDAATTARFLRELRKELSTVYLDGGNTIGTFLNKLEESYGYLSDLCDHKDSSNPIITYVQLHELTDNFATSSEAQKITYEENIKYQFSRAVTILMALGSNTKHQAKKDKLDAKNAVNPKTGKDGWPDVTEGSRDKNGNPYCYLMKGFVRLATFDEMQTWREQCDNSHSENEIFIYDKSGLKVHAVDFAKRMHGRTLEQELRLAGIQNLDSVKSESRHNGHHVEIYYFDYASLQGIMFSMERWGVKRGKRTYKNKDWWPESKGGQDILYNYVRFDRNDIRGAAPSGPGNVSKWFNNKNDYIHVSPEYICWWSTKATDGRPAGIAISQNYNNLFAYLFPMTFLKFA